MVRRPHPLLQNKSFRSQQHKEDYQRMQPLRATSLAALPVCVRALRARRSWTHRHGAHACSNVAMSSLCWWTMAARHT